jgi:hypothetical protein
VVDATDCDDSDPLAYPGAPEIGYDGIDQDCAGGDDFDLDGDGYAGDADDCDDTNPNIHPDVEEVADAVDQDCDGFTAPTGAIHLRGCSTGRPALVGLSALIGAWLAIRRRRAR